MEDDKHTSTLYKFTLDLERNNHVTLNVILIISVSNEATTVVIFFLSE